MSLGSSAQAVGRPSTLQQAITTQTIAVVDLTKAVQSLEAVLEPICLKPHARHDPAAPPNPENASAVVGEVNQNTLDIERVLRRLNELTVRLALDLPKQ